jgi:hypothetical protein
MGSTNRLERHSQICHQGTHREELYNDGISLTSGEMEKIDSMPERFNVCGDDWLPVKLFFGDDE